MKDDYFCVFHCCFIALFWPNLNLKTFNSIRRRLSGLFVHIQENISVSQTCLCSLLIKVSTLSFTFEKPHDVLDGGSLRFLAAALCFYSDRVRPFRYLSFHLDWLAVWRSDRPYCLHIWWEWLLQILFFCVCVCAATILVLSVIMQEWE